MAILNEQFWSKKVDSILEDEDFRAMLVRKLESINRLTSLDNEHIIENLEVALDQYLNNLETMEEGESRIFKINSRHDVYKINRKIKAIQRKRQDNPMLEKYSFTRRNVDDRLLYVMRMINDVSKRPEPFTEVVV